MKLTVEAETLPERVLGDSVILANLNAIMVEHPEPDVVAVVVPLWRLVVGLGREGRGKSIPGVGDPALVGIGRGIADGIGNFLARFTCCDEIGAGNNCSIIFGWDWSAVDDRNVGEESDECEKHID